MRFWPVVLAICISALSDSSLEAGGPIVSTTADSGAGSLRDIIAAAASGDTIQFAATLNGQAITLTILLLKIAQRFNAGKC